MEEIHGKKRHTHMTNLYLTVYSIFKPTFKNILMLINKPTFKAIVDAKVRLKYT